MVWSIGSWLGGLSKVLLVADGCGFEYHGTMEVEILDGLNDGFKFG